MGVNRSSGLVIHSVNDSKLLAIKSNTENCIDSRILLQQFLTFQIGHVIVVDSRIAFMGEHPVDDFRAHDYRVTDSKS